MKDKNTTIAGVGAILLTGGAVLTALFDGDATTVPDWTTTIAAIIAGVGLIMAKDSSTPGSNA